MCCCFVEDVGVHAQTLDTQPSRAPGSSISSAPFLRHPRATAAFALLPQRGGSSTSLCFPPGHTQPSAARPASRSPRRPPLPGASRLPRSLQPWVTTLACRLLQEAPQRPPPRPPRSSRGRTALLSPDASAAGIPRCCARARRKPGASVRERPATSCPLPAHGRSLASTAAHRAAGTRRGWEAARRCSRPPSGDEGREGPAHGSRSRREAKGAGDSGRAAPPPASTRLVPPSPGWQMQPQGGGRFLLSFFFFHRWRKLIILVCVTLTPLQVFSKMLGNR